jgi:hypothetical protein
MSRLLSFSRRRMILALTVALAATATSFAAPAAEPPLALRGVDPNKLSGGLFAALDGLGAFGATPPAARARAGYADLSKGRPPAVLDARVGPNVRLGDDPAALPAAQRGQAEPHLFRSAADPALLLACFQEGRFSDGGALDCGYALSRDGGLSWTRALIPQLTRTSGGAYFRATDPVAAIGPQGDLYLNTLGSIDNAFGLAAVVVSRSSDRGATWTAPAVVYQSPSVLTMPDKNWLAVNDFPGAPNSGRLVATWTNFTSNAGGASTGNNIVAAVSDDRGATWSAPVAVTPAGSNNQGSQPVFLPDGSLALVYVTFSNPNSTTAFRIDCKLSPDGGHTFPAASTTVVASVAGWDDPEVRDGVFLPSATVARASGEIFVTYTAVLNGTPRVLVTKSADKGATWSTPVAASDNPAGRSVMNPAIAASPDGKALSVVFMDKRLAPGGAGLVDHFAALSFDGGATWQPNVRLTETSSDLSYAPQTSRGAMLGDYLGVVPALGNNDPVALAIWCDTRTGDADPFVVRFSAGADAGFGTWLSVRAVNTAAINGDFDGDGVPDYLEFIAGTDPRMSERGDDVLLVRAPDGGRNLFWTERAVVARSPFSDGASVSNGDFSGASVIGASLPPDQLPATPLRAGLAWRGAALPTSNALAATRSFKFSAGLPVTAARNATFTGTDARLINVSTRAQLRSNASPLIVGFVLEGNKTMLVRGAGPALAALGVGGALADPQLRLQALASDLDLTNDNWQSGGSFAASAAVFTRLGAFPFAAGSLDAALALPLGKQSYTAILTSGTGAPGLALVEAYDADATPGAPAGSRILNLSTRADVGTGENALVAGFVIGGTQPRRVLVRAVGPTLATAFGVSGTLADPVLTLYRGATIVASNDDWELARSGAAIAATAQRLGAFALDAASLDAALLITLDPGAYTAVVTGVDGTTGLALVEIYDAD